MTQHDRMVWHFRVAFVVWMVCLTIGTHLPQDPPVENPTFDSPDKLLHFVFFGILTFLFMCSNWVRNVGFLWLIMTMWAFADESTQDILPLQREISSEDFIAGSLGIFATLCWYGALRPPQLRTVKESVQNTLSSTKNCMAIAATGIVLFCAISTGIWFGSVEFFDKQESDLAMALATIVSICGALMLLKRMSGVKCDFLKHKKSAVPILLGTILISVAIILKAHTVHVDKWVLAMLVLVIGARCAWAKAL